MVQVSVRHFKGRMQVDIREMYEKGSELLPGKKGIALTIEQWDALCQAAPEITEAVQAQSGHSQQTGEYAAGCTRNCTVSKWQASM